MTLESQVVLVTGCSTGIGRALAAELASRGHRTFATARRPESIADLKERGVETLRLDVNDARSIDEAVGAAVERAGRIDVLVNNAGINAFGPLLELTADQLRAVFETKLFGLVAVTRAVFPKMAEQGSGRVINIGSVAGLLPTPFAAAYCATKSAVHMLSDVMRQEVSSFGNVALQRRWNVGSHRRILRYLLLGRVRLGFPCPRRSTIVVMQPVEHENGHDLAAAGGRGRRTQGQELTHAPGPLS